jgi:hypothetical protein
MTMEKISLWENENAENFLLNVYSGKIMKQGFSM